MYEPVISHEADPVYVNGFEGKVSLRIGGHNQGQGRIAVVSPKDARILAYALLRTAESQAEEHS